MRIFAVAFVGFVFGVGLVANAMCRTHVKLKYALSKDVVLVPSAWSSQRMRPTVGSQIIAEGYNATWWLNPSSDHEIAAVHGWPLTAHMWPTAYLSAEVSGAANPAEDYYRGAEPVDFRDFHVQKPDGSAVPIALPAQGAWRVRGTFWTADNQFAFIVMSRRAAPRQDSVWLAKIETQTWKVVASSELLFPDPLVGRYLEFPLGLGRSTAMSPDGSLLYIATASQGTLTITAIDTSSLTQRWKISPGAAPTSTMRPPYEAAEIAASGKNRLVVITGRNSRFGVSADTMVVINAEGNVEKVSDVLMGAYTQGIFFVDEKNVLVQNVFASEANNDQCLVLERLNIETGKTSRSYQLPQSLCHVDFHTAGGMWDPVRKLFLVAPANWNTMKIGGFIKQPPPNTNRRYVD